MKDFRMFSIVTYLVNVLSCIGPQERQKSTHYDTGSHSKKVQKESIRRRGVERGAVVSRGHGRKLHEGESPYW